MKTYSFRPKGEGHPRPGKAHEYLQELSRTTALTYQTLLRRCVLFCAEKDFDPRTITRQSAESSEKPAVESRESDREAERGNGLTAAELARQKKKHDEGENDPSRREDEADRNRDEKNHFWDKWTS